MHTAQWYRRTYDSHVKITSRSLYWEAQNYFNIRIPFTELTRASRSVHFFFELFITADSIQA